MKVPLVCRSCGQGQPVDLAGADEKIVCNVCEHESASGDAHLRASVQSKYGKTRFWVRSAGASGFVAILLVIIRITWVESRMNDSPFGLILTITAGLLFATSLTCVILTERTREVIYF